MARRVSTTTQSVAFRNKADVRAFLDSLPGLITGKVRNTQRLSERILRAGAREALELVRQAYRVKAAGGKDEAGTKWKPLKASTKRRKQAEGVDQGILRQTGRLLDSLSSVGGEHSLQVLDTGAGSISIGTDVPYAVHHHFGTETIPRRPLWPPPNRWPRSWWIRIGEAMAEELSRALAK